MTRQLTSNAYISNSNRIKIQVVMLFRRKHKRKMIKLIKTNKNKIKPCRVEITYYIHFIQTCLQSFISNTNLLTSKTFAHNQMKIIEGWVRNLLRLTFLKRNLKLVGWSWRLDLMRDCSKDGQHDRRKSVWKYWIWRWEQLFEGGGHVSYHHTTVV